MEIHFSLKKLPVRRQWFNVTETETISSIQRHFAAFGLAAAVIAAAVVVEIVADAGVAADADVGAAAAASGVVGVAAAAFAGFAENGVVAVRGVLTGFAYACEPWDSGDREVRTAAALMRAEETQR